MTGKKRHLFAGWITGHTYLAYGPLLCNATCVIYEGVPSYPTPARCWDIVEKFKVSSQICKSEVGLFAFSAFSRSCCMCYACDRFYGMRIYQA